MTPTDAANLRKYARKVGAELLDDVNEKIYDCCNELFADWSYLDTLAEQDGLSRTDAAPEFRMTTAAQERLFYDTVLTTLRTHLNNQIRTGVVTWAQNRRM